MSIVDEVANQYDSLVKNVNEEFKNTMKRSDKIAVWITNKVGTMVFFYFCIVMVTIPLIFPSTLPVIGYISSSYLQLILLPLIMVAQNLQQKTSETRAELDYQVGLKSEKEIEIIMRYLKTNHDVLMRILKMIEKVDDDVEDLDTKKEN